MSELEYCDEFFHVFSLYRVYTNPGNGWCLLYVGISDNWPRRVKEHMRDKAWWVDIERIDLEAWCCKRHALAAERRAIETEQPLYNVVHNPKPVLV